jgi:predicted metal-dependent enzyme (double-stranded beta helix superfamily)
MTLANQAPTAPELEGLASVVRRALRRHGDWQSTADSVAEVLRDYLPTPEAALGGAVEPHSRLLHVEPDSTFSIQAIVWPQGRVTKIHDHLTWCVFGVIQGVLDEERFAFDSRDEALVPDGRTTNAIGVVTGFAPPGDIHRVSNTGAGTAVSIHVYGTDLSRMGSSALRYYDRPVAGTR